MEKHIIELTAINEHLANILRPPSTDAERAFGLYIYGELKLANLHLWWDNSCTWSYTSIHTQIEILKLKGVL